MYQLLWINTMKPALHLSSLHDNSTHTQNSFLNFCLCPRSFKLFLEEMEETSLAPCFRQWETKTSGRHRRDLEIGNHIF